MRGAAWIGVAAVVLASGHAHGEVETARGIEVTVSDQFEALRRSYGDLTYADLEKRLKLNEPASAERLGFDPTRVKYFDLIRKSLDLTPEELGIYRKSGVVSVDHGQPSSMAGSYLAIYRNDLPVLITVDSILHALHRSFDAILVEFETWQLAPALEKILSGAHEHLKGEAAKLARPGDAAKDVDLYLTVARNLLANPLTRGQEFERDRAARPGAPNCDNPANFETAECQKATSARLARPLPIASLFGQDAAAREIVAKIVALQAAPLAIYGGRRDVDWSQFRPRGHYANSPALRRYFETMMWLGRADLGFHLSPPSPGTGLVVDVARERADAVVLSDLLRGAGQLDALGALDRLLAYLVGPSDNATPAQVAAAFGGEEAGGLASLADRAVAERVIARVAAARQQILSQGMDPSSEGATAAHLPALFQLFGQRFVIDSFILSRVVSDSVAAGAANEADLRDMPSGLDVMAALGADEAVRVLRPELERYRYAANLPAARTLLGERPPAARSATAYDVWLDALEQPSRPPAPGAVPRAMRTPAWRRKMLQTQLASWAELRHDTILYAKQSYGARILCEYPAGYVEPYPQAFARVASLADELGGRLAKLGAATEHLKTFLGAFSARVRDLQHLADKELAGKPFTPEEQRFIKDAIHVKTSSHGCGGPPSNVYTGWYPTLIYSGAPDSWEPTIADVHTSAEHGVLEVGVGNVDFVVVAVDDGRHRAAYVGPVYSYYELASGSRLTDQDWRGRLNSAQLPARPAWTSAFQGAPSRRTILPPTTDREAATAPPRVRG